MFEFIGPVQTLIGIVEPKIGDMAANRHNHNIFHHHQQNSNFLLTYLQYKSLVIFMILFLLCAAEVIFMKIAQAINIDDSSIDIDGETYPLPTELDLMNNNSVRQIDREQRHHQQRSVVAHLISTQSFLQRITAVQATQPFGDINNNSNLIMNNNNNNNNIADRNVVSNFH